MRNWNLIGLGIAYLSCASIEAAQPGNLPTIVVIDAERSVDAGVIADSKHDGDPIIYTAAGPWIRSDLAQTTGEHASTGRAEVEQDSDISAYSIRGEGSASAISVLGIGADAEITVGAAATIEVQFMMPVEAPYSLTGSFTAGGDQVGGICLAGGGVSMIETDVDNVVHFLHDHNFSCDDPPEDAAFHFFGTVGANSTIYFSVGATVIGAGDQFADLTGEGSATFTFVLDFGDRDGDGLLDAWEKNGIDFPGPGIEIDLPGMGANPDKKDIFVEVDVMEGIGFDQQAIDDVILAFAWAPDFMVDNPNGTLGIQLHVVLDGDQPSHEPIIRNPPGLPPEYYAIKDSFFGSEADRNHSAWDEIRKAKLLIYRYCLWADTLTLLTVDADHALGAAEAIPSNDFIVAAGRVLSTRPNISTQALAGTFMHELGHTLGLNHGGQNDENAKPNYLSVMNYAYTIPLEATTSQGTSAADFWRLDYSRSTMTDLDETELHETRGIGGPSGRFIFYNYKRETDPDPVKRGMTRADRLTMNWDGDQDDPDLAPFELDINRTSEDQDPEYDPTLESFTDWDRLWYHLSGTSDFDDRKPWPGAIPAEAIDEATIDAFLNVEWTDFTLLDDEIFANGFELGSPTAWSHTVP